MARCDEDHAKIRSLLEGLRPADNAEVLNAVPSLGEDATLVDVTGLIIYFSVAHVVLRGTLL